MCFGTNFTKDNYEMDEINRGSMLVSRTFHLVLLILKNENVHRKTKFIIYRTRIRWVQEVNSEASLRAKRQCF